MNKQEAIEIIKNSFYHLMFEENVKVGSIDILLYFPSIGIAILEPKKDRKHLLLEDNIEDMDELYIKKELEAKPIYLDLEEDKFNIGFVINDILLEARFAPSENFLESRGTY
ncbi:TPA: hypothetical protein QCR36_003956 [Bacillus cereus]|nr:hypothetical protein [Bacillus cereus]HDR4736905.1 hypothetical protein [Bacillus cereus]HDR4742425.1 hypothetical protein [Bacillus cereus]HDR4748012.1 hypothetical protein [Bacillus cereus]HDR4753486.1 hypothetical protein [Bacillus cereus]